MPKKSQKNLWIWPFELEEKIGEGGMGIVYRARYVGNNRRVAVKLLPEAVADDEIILARFQREMEILKTFRHPNIVYSFGGVCENQQPFYAMELVEGGTLKDLLRQRGRLPWEQVIEFGQQLCAALAYAHENHVIHRDIKPGNVLLTKDHRLKLSDFGIALVRSAPKLTSDGQTVGSFAYMAPEQIRGKPAISPQTDLYALGCVLFELLAGRPPFERETTAQILHQHLKTPPPRVTEFAFDCPAGLDSLISRLLEKDPAHRPIDATAVARELKNISPTIFVKKSDDKRVFRHPAADLTDSQEISVSRPVSPHLRRPVVWLLLAGVVVIAVLLVWNMTLQRTARIAAQSEALWIKALHHREATIRITAVAALGKLARDSGTALDALVKKGLSDEHDGVRWAAAKELGALGATANPAVLALEKIKKIDEAVTVRSEAATALEQIRDAEPRQSNWSLFVIFALLAVLSAGFVVAKKYPRLWQRLPSTPPVSSPYEGED